MPTYLNETLRIALITQASESYFPEETEQMARKSMQDLFTSWCEQAFGPPPCLSGKPNGFTYFLAKAEYIIRTDTDFGPEEIGFTAQWIRAPFLVPYHEGQKTNRQIIKGELCPIPGLMDTARALASFRAEKKTFENFMTGELMKYSTAETFIRRFPALEGIITQITGKAVSDLPVECMIDINALAERLSLQG